MVLSYHERNDIEVVGCVFFMWIDFCFLVMLWNIGVSFAK